MNVSVETITPDQANAWLETNSRNRSLKDNVVNRLAGAILRGEWAMNGESIKINGSQLLDGQHRLAAIVKAGIPVKSVVVRDVDVAAQETIDLGTRRSVGDILAIRGEEEAQTLAAALVHIFNWRSFRRIGRTYRVTYPTPQQQLALLDTNPGIRQSLPVGKSVKNRLKKYPQSLGAALHYLFAEIDRDDASDFWEKLTTGVGLEEGSPILVLRRHIQEETGTPHTRPNLEKKAAFTVKAWNAYREGTEIKRLRYMPGGKSPEPFPVPR